MSENAWMVLPNQMNNSLTWFSQFGTVVNDKDLFPKPSTLIFYKQPKKNHRIQRGKKITCSRECRIPGYCKFCSRVTGWYQNTSVALEAAARASLVVQWLGVCLPMQGTRVRALVWEGPTCHGATKPVSHNYWACASGACAPQQERPQQWEARAPRWRVAPACHN